MGRKSLTLVLVGLVILSGLLGGCRKSAVPPIEELTPEEELSAAVTEAQENTDQTGQGESPLATVQPEPDITQATPVPTAEPTAEPEVEPTVVVVTVEPTAEPVVEATEVPTAPQAPGLVAGTSTYTVKPGDNLFRIALRNNVTVQALAQANNITNPGLIYVGQTLTIPAGGSIPTQPTTPSGCTTVYVVKPGDNLFRIALRYNYSQYYLAQFNNISNPAMVNVGQAICIP
ncbi:MAG: LysM peptidoglycan-binding domain-containing protein [Anaerolineae bacterium]|jgi:LysM repeat protein|nr:LysM peptidoglycan-binding domain-containing protein [Anaerolineae bacterium]